MKKYIDVVQDQFGNAVSGASVLVRVAGGAAATIYSNNGTTIATNPLTTDSRGNFSFYAADGRYDIDVTYGQVTYYVTDVLIEDPSNDQSSDISYTPAGVGAVVTNVQTKLREFVSVKDFGAVGDGVADDTAAIQAAVDSLNGLGGVVFLTATGNAYKTSDTITLPNGVILAGSLGKNFAGSTATNVQWAAAGSWLNPTHISNPAVKLQGHGSGISGIGFIHNQPIPGGSWTPTTYGYCIENVASHTTIEDILIVNASHGIYFNYTSVSGGGTQVRMRDVIVSAYSVRVRTTCVNDTMYWSNIHMRNLWYSSNALVTAYIRANAKGWYCGYTDNIMVDGIEFFEDADAIYFEDETCLGNTHSLYNATLNNVQFNLPKVCMRVAATNTNVRAHFGTVLSQTGNAFGLTWADTAFQLGSDNVDINIASLTVVDAGGQLCTLGNGTGGKLHIASLTVEHYSSVSAGQVCFSVNAGSKLRLGDYRISKSGTAGPRFSGAGLENVVTGVYGHWQVFGRFTEATLAGNGSYRDMSTVCNFRPGQAGVHQARLIGDIYISVPSAATTANVRISGISELTVTSIDTSSSAWKTFDTGWVDLTETSLSSLATFGSFQVQSNAAVTVQNGSVHVIWR